MKPHYSTLHIKIINIISRLLFVFPVLGVINSSKSYKVPLCPLNFSKREEEFDISVVKLGDPRSVLTGTFRKRRSNGKCRGHRPSEHAGAIRTPEEFIPRLQLYMMRHVCGMEECASMMVVPGAQSYIPCPPQAGLNFQRSAIRLFWNKLQN